jgi:hypothetical protein
MARSFFGGCGGALAAGAFVLSPKVLGLPSSQSQTVTIFWFQQ